MNLALWRKAVSDAWRQLAISSALLILFSWAFVWLMSQLPTDAFAVVLRWIPGFLRSLIRVPIADLASRAGQLTILFVHVITLLICVGWALGRGSDSISGEIARGTMDLLLSLPVRRVSVMVVPAVVATLGAAMLAGSILVGIALGLCTVRLGDSLSTWQFLPGAINLFAMTFCLIGLTTFVSSWNRDRWRTIGLSGGFFVISLAVELLRRLWPGGSWLKYCTFLSAFQPQELILQNDAVRPGALWYDGPLVVLGVLCFVAGGVVLSRRDIPAAL